MTDRARDAGLAERRFTRRAIALGIFQAGIFGGLVSRLYQLQVLEASETAALAEDNRTRRLVIAPRRGRILDASGEVLAANRESFRVVMQPRRTLDASVLRHELRRLGPLVGLTDDDQERLLLVAARDSRERPLLIAANLSFEQVAALEVRSLEFPFLTTEAAWARTFETGSGPKASAMAHVVGTLGAVERLAMDDDQVLRLANARIGKTGVEAGMEQELRGLAGTAVIEVDARGRQLRRVKETTPRNGRDVTLSLDAALQVKVQERLAQDGHTGAVVALDVTTGEVCIMTSAPTYDPTPLAGGHPPRAVWDALLADQSRPLVNRAIAGLYPPGSTFKLVTALAALKAGQLTTKEKIECWGDVTYSGHLFRCWNRKGHRISDLHKALPPQGPARKLRLLFLRGRPPHRHGRHRRHGP